VAASDAHRFYDELAEWWPLISPPEDYVEEAAFALTVLRRASVPVREVLELGSGGGNNAVHLKSALDMTLVDLSPAMVRVSERLNPECTHLVGDMRNVRLGRRFDAVFVHDAIDYMSTRDDLMAAVLTAFEHTRPGGIAVFVPDAVRAAGELADDEDDVWGDEAPDGRAVRVLQWDWDPDPADDWTQTEYVFVLRDADGDVRTIHESHRTGWFTEAVWLDVLREAGFEPEAVEEVTSEDRPPRTFFAAHHPG
jgi:SAM-dependent methyltransferase